MSDYQKDFIETLSHLFFGKFIRRKVFSKSGENSKKIHVWECCGQSSQNVARRKEEEFKNKQKWTLICRCLMRANKNMRWGGEKKIWVHKITNFFTFFFLLRRRFFLFSDGRRTHSTYFLSIWNFNIIQFNRAHIILASITFIQMPLTDPRIYPLSGLLCTN